MDGNMNWEELLKTEPGQRLVCEIGGQPKPQAQEVFKDDKILHLNADDQYKPDILADAENMPPELYEKLDGVFASHVLEHFSYWKTDKILQGWIRCLKEGGEIHILVPSLEWAARQILSEQPSPAVYGQLYAGQTTPWDLHLTGFTMRKLRQLMERAGIAVNIARTGVYHIRVGDMGDFPAEQHYIAGIKGIPALRKS